MIYQCALAVCRAQKWFLCGSEVYLKTKDSCVIIDSVYREQEVEEDWSLQEELERSFSRAWNMSERFNFKLRPCWSNLEFYLNAEFSIILLKSFSINLSLNYLQSIRLYVIKSFHAILIVQHFAICWQEDFTWWIGGTGGIDNHVTLTPNDLMLFQATLNSLHFLFAVANE